MTEKKSILIRLSSKPTCALR